jgi:ABC-type Zn uptake system ZnuABC Zn-binding protein ZnuA
VTKQQFDEGATYVSLMKHNLTVLKKALKNE